MPIHLSLTRLTRQRHDQAETFILAGYYTLFWYFNRILIIFEGAISTGLEYYSAVSPNSTGGNCVLAYQI